MDLSLKQAVDMIGELKDKIMTMSHTIARLEYENCSLRKENSVLRNKLLSLGDTTIHIKKSESKHSNIGTNRCKVIKKLYANGKIVAYILLYPDNTTSQVSAPSLKYRMANGDINVSNATLTSNNKIIVKW